MNRTRIPSTALVTAITLGVVLVLSLLLLPQQGAESDLLPVQQAKLPNTADANNSNASNAESRNRYDNPVPSASLGFIQNEGQVDANFDFHLQSAGHAILFGSDGVVFRRDHLEDSGLINRTSFSVDYLDSDAGTILYGMDQQPGTANFYRGNDPSQWKSDVATFSTVKQAGVYNGIDILYSAPSGQLKREFYVYPGSDPATIQMRYDGISELAIKEDGRLSMKTALGEMTESTPVIFQWKNGKKQSVEGEYRQIDPETIGFTIGTYDATKLLIIDPDYAFASYLGGSSFDFLRDIDSNSEGHLFIGGSTSSADFPVENAHQPALSDSDDFFIMRVDPATGTILYSTFLGGTGSESLASVRVDDSDNVFIYGQTASADFPTPNATQPDFAGGRDAVLAKFGPTGTLLFATYLGGTETDRGYAMDLDADGAPWLSGVTYSPDFPTTPDAETPDAPGNADAFLTRISADGSSMTYSTYVGGGNNDFGNGIAIDDANVIFLAGASASTSFIGAPISGGTAAYVVSLPFDGISAPSISGSCIIDGTSGESMADVKVDASWAFFGGTTSGGLPTTVGAHQPDYGGNGDGMIGACNKSTMEIAYLSYDGGSEYEYIGAIDIQPQGLGKGNSDPERVQLFWTRIVSALETSTKWLGLALAGDPDAPIMTALILSTVFDLNQLEAGAVHAEATKVTVGASTENEALETTNNAISSVHSGRYDAYVASAIIEPLGPPPGAVFGSKFLDIDGDGIEDPDDFPVEGVVIELRLDNVIIDSKPTDIDGNYRFDGVEPDDYTLTEAPASGLTATKPVGGIYNVTVISGEDAGPFVFGNEGPLDFGDLPDPRENLPAECPLGNPLSCYRTLASVQGAAHVIYSPSIVLGSRVDAEPNGQPSPFANGDDDNIGSIGGEDDEDGLVSFTILDGGIFQVTVNVRDDAGNGGSLSVFVDLNDDGVLNDGSVPGGTRERVIQTAVVQGLNTLQSPPGAIMPGDKIEFIRLRIAEKDVPLAWGVALNGEVEDYHRSSIATAFEYEGPSDLPESYTLSQNFPNPFTDFTTIEVKLPEEDEVTVVVHDVLGKEVATLHNGLLPPGPQRFQFDATGLASGIYFYTLDTGSHSKTNRMILMR